MKLPPDLQHKFTEIRTEWSGNFQPRMGHLGAGVFEVPARLSQSMVEGAIVYASRVDAMNQISSGGRLAEVGTQTGWFAGKLLEVCAPNELHLFDLEFETLRSHRPDIIHNEVVRLHEGDSSEKLAALPDEHFDCIYVDGDHRLEGVLRDARVAEHKLKKDGLLIFNDYTFWSPLEMDVYGVINAVNGLLESGSWKLVYLALHPLMYCDVGLRRV